MAQAINRYKADLRELNFILFEQFKLGETVGKGPFAEWDADDIPMILEEVYRFAMEVTGPLHSVGDREGCRIEDGKVITPSGFKEAWDKFYEAGYQSLGVTDEFGGQNAPAAVSVAAAELNSGPNTAFNMYPELTMGAADLIEEFGTKEQRETYCPKMYCGEWGGTMCLTEPQAGSDVGAAQTFAKKNPDGTYQITGGKIFISGGDQDLTDNIVHMVLARTDDAPKGTKGLSLFIVPKNRVKDDGSLESNDVKIVSIEHKMGLNGSSTSQLAFGEDGDCVGELLGTEERHGMRQMFQMMNFARLGVGLQGLAIASTAYLNALEYAKDRKQGSSIESWKDPEAPRVAIINHPDVRRMLLDMKSRVEGVRALITWAAICEDRARVSESEGDHEAATRHRGRLELLTPLIKAYSSDQAFYICEQGIQVLGGVGYTNDFPLEQYCRDSKIFSIYEGTNHIQAVDLVGRKLNMAGGQYAQQLFQDIGKFIAKHKEHPALGSAVQTLDKAQAAVGQTAMQFMTWFQEGKMDMVPLKANRFLLMTAQLTVAWLLIDGAAIALEAQEKLEKSDPDYNFYEGKKYSALFYANNVLPEVILGAKIVQSPDRSAIDIPEEAFSTL